MNPNFKKTKYACYFAYIAMASVFSLPPMLFVTFKEMYNISYTLLGTLVLVNFCTQLGIDLIFTFFTKYFNVKKTVRLMPLLTATGLLVYAISPVLFPNHIYLGLVLGTMIFSVAAGLGEVLLSPVVAALPSETPDKDMSTLHSLYGWGVVTVVVISSIFFKIFGRTNWMYLTVMWAILPIIACYLFCISPFPDMDVTSHEDKHNSSGKGKILTLCALCIFLGSAAENSMTNWISTYMEEALHISKTVGDIFGMAVFAFLLAMTRNAYAKYGKNILRVLLLGMAGAALCYLTAGLSNNVIVAFASCIFTGICTSMLWPGTLILMEEKTPNPGVAAYALMAAAGDMGASVAPQLVGAVADQAGIRVSMLIAAGFPLMGVILLLSMRQLFAIKNV